MSKILFLFTNSYPFSSGETFIENELPYLAHAFDRVVIVSNDINGIQTRAVPQNVQLERMPYSLSIKHKVFSLLGLFSPAVWREFMLIRSLYRRQISRIIFNTVLQSYWKSRVLNTVIQRFIRKYSTSTDEVYLYSYWSNDVALALAQIPQSNSIRCKIARAHGWDVYFEANEANYLPFRQLILKNLDFQIFISEKGRSYYRVLYPELTHKMAVSRLGVARQNAMNERYIKDKCIIATCSNIIPLKRVSLIAEAIAKLHIGAIEWHHFGDGPMMDELKSLCSQAFSDRTDITICLHGRVQNSDFIRFISENPIFAFINASTSEGIPVSIMEAMCVGIPCIATAVGGTPEIVNSANGILLDPNPTADQIAQAIVNLYNMREDEYLGTRQAAYETWNVQYNAERNYQQFIQEILLGDAQA